MNKVVFQAVNNQYITESAGAWDIDEKISKIVFIGKNLQTQYFEEGLRVCISDISSESSAFYQPLFYNSKQV